MEQFSTSKVTVEYFDPHDVYKLILPGLIPRLPLRHLHWHSHAGPLRSIDTLHVELAQAGAEPAPEPSASRSGSVSTNHDAATTSTDSAEAPAAQPKSKGRRHQIPGLRRTPYLKVLLVRCDDSESYKGRVRSEIRDWVKVNAAQTKKGTPEGHDACEWLIVHVVVPNTTAATQPPSSKVDVSTTDKGASRWRGGSSTLLEKMKADFNGASKGAVDRVAQVRVGINDVPYNVLPRVVPAVPSGYAETEQDVEAAWQDLIAKFKDLILTSFDLRVTRYEEDLKEKDGQRMLPGWNFCTFFILKEGLARGFESVGLVEDALVGYDELSVGLDAIIAEQATSGAPERHGGALLPYTTDLKEAVDKALEALETEEEAEPGEVDADDIPIIASKKPYRDMILENNVSLFDFKCYIFARQITLLLRLGNAWSTREELLARLKEQQELVIHGVAPHTPPTNDTNEPEDLQKLSEICRRTLEFIPLVSRAMQQDILAAVASEKEEEGKQRQLPASLTTVVDHMVASFAFSIAQQVLAQTSTKALPIPPSTLTTPDGHEPKLSIPEPKTMMHPARSSSLGTPAAGRPPPSPNVFPGPGNTSGPSEKETAIQSQFLKAGLEELAARRAELYSLCRNILEKLGEAKGWNDGWSDVPVLPDSVDYSEMEDVDLGEGSATPTADQPEGSAMPVADKTKDSAALALRVVSNPLLRAAFRSEDDFYRLYETLTDKALRHYTVANHENSIQANLADMAVLKHKVGDYGVSASYFHRATPFFGETGWGLLELSMLVMYARCLRELGRKEGFVQVVLKMLMRAAAAEAEFEGRASASVSKSKGDFSAVRGFVAELLEAAGELPREVVVPLSSFFLAVDVCGAPGYTEGSDKVEVEVELHSLLEDELPVERAGLRMTCVDGGPTNEISLEGVKGQVVKPGKSRLTFVGKVVATGQYKVDQLTLQNGKLTLSYERDVEQITPRDETIFRNPPILVYQQTRSFDLRLTAARHTRLDQNNALELEVSTGWNEMQSCEVSVRPATGGLRTITAEATVLSDGDGEGEFAKPPEAGMLFLGAVEKGSSVRISFPFSVEQDVPTVSVRLDATYVTEEGTFRCAKVATVPIALALGVNVQDVFKHTALYSRFTVSTATGGPLRLFESELKESEVFETAFGVPPPGPVMVFGKQPATVLYRVTRREGAGKGDKTTMYLRLWYSVLQEEVEDALTMAMEGALEEAGLERFARLLGPVVGRWAGKKLPALELERAALTGRLSTSFLAGINWRAELLGLDHPRSTEPSIPQIVKFFEGWLGRNKTLEVAEPKEGERRSIVIPVDIPSVPLLVTADMQLAEEAEVLGPGPDDVVPTVVVNQVLPAKLKLRWTRRWDTAKDKAAAGQVGKFSFEVSQGDWLLSGRRRGHITIPEDEASDEGVEIPLVVAPLREGYLSYPNIEIREVRGEEVEGKGERGAVCEMDWKNAGEVVRVVEGREGVTVSLDEGGQGGGPLVVEGVGGRGVSLLV